eukprot:CAMPEP_0202699700 /NCGR_PEP_ID=MMETSP1385-20130828/12911_1 /ASSEMBLY_ACC=CAM_ASM_000861 /TAXON_ID=933848 /ORGANISM="Elphidium margaritaceum" /LENGTH=141 /DNA_ID=CAMNT_0049356697 /DNA_START=35 /DNA_END=460 /DNA_ORIENTATION=-
MATENKKVEVKATRPRKRSRNFPKVKKHAPPDNEALNALATSLESDIKNRENVNNLIQKKIIKKPALQNTESTNLEQQMKTDKLKMKLTNKPSANELYENGVLKHKNVASKLQNSANDLEQKLKKDILKKNIQNASGKETE